MTSSFKYNIKVGDIIVAHRKGIHVVVEVERRFVDEYLAGCSACGNLGDEYNSLIHYRQIAKVSGVKVNGKKIYMCDESYCAIVGDDWFQNRITELDDTRRAIERLRRKLVEDE